MFYDVIIIGNGPAGISASLYTTRSNFKTLIIGNNKSPLVKTDKIENYYGFAEPVSGADLLLEGEKQTKRLGTEIIHDDVVSISQDYESAETRFLVSTPMNTYECSAVLIAVGQPVAKVNIKGLKEFEGKGISYCSTCDGFFYRNKKIGVIGSKDFALHEALELETFSKDITIFTNGSEPDFSAIYQEYADHFKINTLKISAFSGDDYLKAIEFADGSKCEIDGLFIALDSASGVNFAKKLGIEMVNNAIVTTKDQETNIPGIFAAGDCTGGLKQIATAVGQGAVAGKKIIDHIKKVRIKK